ncbi:MAG: helix-turn-helix transcriptional regulator [Clostridia bacterium]|nr:helix-turn-helix transcriptional regulator [Clostridia bacterium]
MPLCDKLIALRIQQGLSQEELAAALAVSRQTIGKWESAQAQPELNGLLAISDFFRVTLDSLVRDEPCAPALHSAAPVHELIPFLLRAKHSTYAGHGPEDRPSCPGAHDFTYAEGTLTYHDRYIGGECFFGEEIVWCEARPIWRMNYGGRTLSSAFSGDFLKRALCHGTETMPYRGPALYREGDYTYQCTTRGSMDWFSGKEAIYLRDEVIYECRFHGGAPR